MEKTEFENITCTYPLIFKLIFRYGNIFLTLILAVYLFPLILYVDQKNILIIPILISLIIIYFVNRHYITLYKILPYKIEADQEKIVCTDFFLSRKEITINYRDIQSLNGGVFENKLSGVMKVCDATNFFCVGFYQKLKNSNKLITIILSKVNRELYDEVLEKLTAKGKNK